MAAYVDSTFSAQRSSTRPVEFNGYGHYRAVTFSGASNTIGAGTSGILASLWWKDATRKFVLTRLAMNIEVLSNITAAPVFDAQAFVTRGITGASAGSGSSTLTATGNNQKTDSARMGTTLLTSSGGELRTLGTTTALTAATGKTNDSAPFGAAFFGALYNSSATGVATLLTVGAAVSPGWQDLFTLTPYNHPIVVGLNEGIEIQAITANNTSGTVKYGFLWEWAETDKW